MAINNTVQSGLLNTQGGALVPPNNGGQSSLTLGQQAFGNPAPVNFAPLANKITGLVSPTIAPIGSVGSSPVVNHTITTAPDGTTTQKVTHADTTSTDTSGGGSTTTPPPPAPPAPATPPPTPTGNTGAVTFPGIVGSAVSGANNAVTTGQTQEQQAYAAAQAAQNELTQSKQNEAGTLANMAGNPIPIEFQQGRGNITQNLYQTQQANIASQLQGESALATTGANLQSTGLGALGTAGSQTQPTGSYPFVFNPTTGTYTNASDGSVMTPTQIATAINNGQMSPSQGLDAGNYLGTSAQSQIASAMNTVNPSYNWNTGAAAAGGAASNVGTATTATTNAYNNIYQTATTAGAGYSTAQNSINSLGTNVLSTMANTPGINTNDSRFLNTQLNGLSTQFNSPAYANFNAQIAGLQRMVSQYLSAGEIPTSATQGAQALVDGSLTVGALAATLKGIDSDLDAAITAQKTTADYAKGQLGTGGNSGGSSSTGSNTGAFSDSSFFGSNQ